MTFQLFHFSTNRYSEFQRFTPLIPVMIHHGGKDARREKAEKIYKKSRCGPWKVKPVVITSYEMIIHDRKVVSNEYTVSYIVLISITTTICRLPVQEFYVAPLPYPSGYWSSFLEVSDHR